MPGDEHIPQAADALTHGVTIRRAPRDVWPWLVQMGAGSRGGWYSYDWLEHLIGAGDFAEGGSAKRLIPELQQLALGDAVALSPAGGLTVAVFEPARALVLHYRMNLLTAGPAHDGEPAILDWTWAFVLAPVNDGSCRLLARVRTDYRPRWLLPLMPLLLEPVHFLMERKMLRTIEQQVRRWR